MLFKYSKVLCIHEMKVDDGRKNVHKMRARESEIHLPAPLLAHVCHHHRFKKIFHHHHKMKFYTQRDHELFFLPFLPFLPFFFFCCAQRENENFPSARSWDRRNLALTQKKRGKLCCLCLFLCSQFLLWVFWCRLSCFLKFCSFGRWSVSKHEFGRLLVVWKVEDNKAKQIFCDFFSSSCWSCMAKKVFFLEFSPFHDFFRKMKFHWKFLSAGRRCRWQLWMMENFFLRFPHSLRSSQ